jgi:hypothetical protein
MRPVLNLLEAAVFNCRCPLAGSFSYFSSIMWNALFIAQYLPRRLLMGGKGETGSLQKINSLWKTETSEL